MRIPFEELLRFHDYDKAVKIYNEQTLKMLIKVYGKEEGLKQYNHWICPDCGKNTNIDNKDYYMVTDELWHKHGNGEGMICVDCFEKRLGRKLTKNDIKHCPLTMETNLYTKSILNNSINN